MQASGSPSLCEILAFDIFGACTAPSIDTYTCYRTGNWGLSATIRPGVVTEAATTSTSEGTALTSLRPHPSPYELIL